MGSNRCIELHNESTETGENVPPAEDSRGSNPH